MFKKESKIKRFDFILLITTILLSVYGFIVIGSATMSKAIGSEPYLRTQILAFAVGLVALFVLVFIDYDLYGTFYIPIYVLTNLLLLYTLINPVEASEWGDVRSWIAIGPIVFQPSELAKFGVIISLAKFIDIHKDRISQPLILLKVLIFAFVPVGLILLQPDFGTAMVFVFFIGIMIFVAGIDKKYILGILIVGIVVLIIGAGAFFEIIEDYNLGDDYRFDRIVIFLYPDLDPDDKGYQVIQSKTAIGSGMLHGRGLYNGIQNQLDYLPTKETDFIFAVIGEELGLIGGIVLLSLYAILFHRLIRIAKNAASLFGSLMVTGIAAMFLIHIFQNIGMTMGLMPVTGIPLPFISYGGTFMLVNMVSIGLCLSVGMKRGKIDLNEF